MHKHIKIHTKFFNFSFYNISHFWLDGYFIRYTWICCPFSRFGSYAMAFTDRCFRLQPLGGTAQEASFNPEVSFCTRIYVPLSVYAAVCLKTFISSLTWKKKNQDSPIICSSPSVKNFAWRSVQMQYSIDWSQLCMNESRTKEGIMNKTAAVIGWLSDVSGPTGREAGRTSEWQLLPLPFPTSNLVQEHLAHRPWNDASLSLWPLFSSSREPSPAAEQQGKKGKVKLNSAPC